MRIVRGWAGDDRDDDWMAHGGLPLPVAGRWENYRPTYIQCQ